MAAETKPDEERTAIRINQCYPPVKINKHCQFIHN